MKIFAATLVMTALLAVAAGGTVNAQERMMRRATAGEPAMLNKAMTQSQARKVCQSQMRGARESKAALRQKMSRCVNEQMQGN